MKRASYLVGSLLVLGLAPAATADTIQVSSGALTWSRFGEPVRLDLAGPDGFTFTGGSSPSGGVFQPWNQCGVPECLAGTAVDLAASWLGNDLPGTATYQGTTYTGVGGLGVDAAQMAASFSGSLTIPALFVGGILNAPFQFQGAFAYPQGPFNELTTLGLVGGGTASLAFSPWSAFPGAFVLDAVRYEFDGDATLAPVPEPASMLLIGTGLAGLAALRRRRVRTDEPSGA